MSDEQHPQQSPRTDAWWRRLRDSLDPEQRRQLYAGEMFIGGTDRVEVGDEGDVVEIDRRERLRPPDWLQLEEQLGD